MTINHRKVARAIFTIDGGDDYSCQLTNAQVVDNTPDGDRFYTFCADGTGEAREEVDPAWQLQLTWKSDWTTAGINRFVQDHDGETLAMSVTFDTGNAATVRTWTGNVVVKAPGDGGAARTTFESTVTWNYIGEPTVAYAEPS